jgi:hypothetical protein
LAFPVLFVLLVHIVTPETTEAVENSTNWTHIWLIWHFVKRLLNGCYTDGFQSCDYPHFICISFRQFDWYIYIILWAPYICLCIFTFNIHLLVSAIYMYYIYFADESHQCNSRWGVVSRNVR